MHPASLPTDTDLVRRRFRCGDFAVSICTDGTYFLDGGAMFGVVPKALWQKRTPADADNRILLGLNSLVVQTGKHTVLIETGIGNKQSPKMRAIHGNQELLPASLAAAGIRPDQVDVVINTHLHFDHCGWNTTLHLDGAVTPTFPNARYFAHRGEVAHGHLQLERDAVSYLSSNYDPLIASGQMTLIDNEAIAAGGQIVPGISVEIFPGHTANMLAVHVESAGEHACYAGDLFPTTHHLDPTWVMSYDLDPIRCIAERKRFLARAIPEHWHVIFTHDHHVPAATIALNEKGKPVAQEHNQVVLRRTTETMVNSKDLITQAYTAFNQRDIEGALALMSDDVSWPKASEGGRVLGKQEIRAYWTRQWSEFDPHVEPVEVTHRTDGKTEVRVHQFVKNLTGEVLSDSEVWHVYTIVNGLIERMDLKETEGRSNLTPSLAFHTR